MISASFALFALASTAFAAPGYYEPSPTYSSAPYGATHTIIVGGDAGLVYTPPFVSADVNDVILFEFHQKNHSATQSSFADPCVPLYGGFDSGFNPVDADATYFPTFNITVYDNNPIWVHCEQTGHCGQGMVFAVNPDESQESLASFEIFQARAIALNGTESPTQTATSPVTTHTVIVGGDQLLYDPPFVTADIDDVIIFEFHKKNHTATQSSFGEPCVPLYGGFDSGFMPVAPDATDFPTFSYTVCDSNPVWVHCEQTGHCGQGMTFAINPDESQYSQKTYEAFKALAIQINGTDSNAPPPPPESTYCPTSTYDTYTPPTDAPSYDTYTPAPPSYTDAPSYDTPSYDTYDAPSYTPASYRRSRNF